jgi:hypothetical protein
MGHPLGLLVGSRSERRGGGLYRGPEHAFARADAGSGIQGIRGLVLRSWRFAKGT